MPSITTAPPRGHVSRPVAHITAQLEIVRAQASAAFWANPSAPEAGTLSSLASALMGLLQVVEESRQPGMDLCLGGVHGGAGISISVRPSARPVAAPAPAVGLSFGGVAIRDRDDRVSLTDMWKAAGGDRSKRPGEWLRQEATVQFLAYLKSNMGGAHICETSRGVGGGTWAHWQVAMAYAKYLSPSFHAWCNSVVRQHMEARGARVLP